MQDFQRQIDDERQRRLQILKQLEVERVRIAMQQWTRDREATECTQCHQDFTLLRRKVRALNA